MNAHINMQLYYIHHQIEAPSSTLGQQALEQELVNRIEEVYDIKEIIWVPPTVPVSDVDTTKPWLRLSL